MTDNIRAELFARLKALAVKEVTVRYSGSGDSGSIEEVLFDQVPAEKFSDKIEVSEQVSRFDNEENVFVAFTRKVMVSLGDAVENWCWDNIESLHPGWEINEGSDGEFTFSVDEGKVKLVHNENVMTQNTMETEL
jgi:hypothetical protein